MITIPLDGALRVWWIPQMPMSDAFHVDVSSVEEGAKMLEVLAEYDLFQLRHRVKGDYANTGGLEQYCAEDGSWEDWSDEATGEDDPRAFVESRRLAASKA